MHLESTAPLKATSRNTFRILVVDDESSIRNLLHTYLQRKGYEVRAANGGAAAVELVKSEPFDLILLDIMMPEMDGLQTLSAIKELDQELPVFLMTAYGTIDRAVEAMKRGAIEFLLKPLSLDVLSVLVERIREHAVLKASSQANPDRVNMMAGGRVLLTRNRQMREILTLVGKMASLPSTVLVEGESGTGKELVARAIHEWGPRSENSFVALNCAVLPGQLLESELFGYEKGAFTGATARKNGYFEAAMGGTILLDEISEMDVELQAKLLRVIQEKTFQRLGSTKEITSDARIIASTNRDLEEEVQLGRFRKDLYYRINVVKISVPPLRERPEDIPLLGYHFLTKYSREFGKGVLGMKRQVVDLLVQHPWEGNVRELENVIEHAVAVTEGKEITLRDLPEALKGRGRTAKASRQMKPYRTAKQDFEREYLTLLLERAQGNIALVARMSEIPRQNLYGKLEKLGIDPDDYR